MTRAVRSFRTVGEDVSLYSDVDVAIDDSIEVEGNTALDFFDWAMQVPEPKAGPLDFNKFPFQRELYANEWVDDRDGCVMKGTQLGVSAWIVRWLLFWADRGLTALYVQPKEKFLTEFSNMRIAPLLKSEYLASRVRQGDVNNALLRQIGAKGFFNLRGSQTKDALDAVDADVLGLDEYDTLEQQNIPDAEQRVTAPTSKGLIRRVGVPSTPGFGISAFYEKSDQRQWLVKCGSCNERQTIDFWKNVDIERELLVCAKCHKPLDTREGEWVAEFPDRDTRGYHLSKLLVPGLRLRTLIEQSTSRKPYTIQVFHNKGLGLPFAPVEGKLTQEAINAASRDFGMVSGYGGDNTVTMGVDVASVRNLHVRISEHLSERIKRQLWSGEVESFDDLAALMDRFNVNMACIDHLPEGRLARAFAALFPGRVYIVSYATETQKDVLTLDDDQRRVSVRRTEAHDGVIHLINAQRNLLAADRPGGPEGEYDTHLLSPTRYVDKDEELDKVSVYYRATGPDDYFQAEVYDLVAIECWWARVAIDASQREDYSTLDDHYEIERVDLTEASEDEGYNAGPDEGDWSGSALVDDDDL